MLNKTSKIKNKKIESFVCNRWKAQKSDNLHFRENPFRKKNVTLVNADHP